MTHLVVVPRAEKQAEVEFLQALRHAEGVPSVLGGTAGLDVPNLLAAVASGMLVAPFAERGARRPARQLPG